MNNYLYIYPPINIVEYHIAGNKTLILQSYEQQVKHRVTGGKEYEINEIALEILMKFDGTRTYQDIINYFSEKYNETYKDVDSKVKFFIDTLSNQYGFKIKEQNIPSKQEVHFIKYSNIYPTIASIELTDKCNIKCKHCYGHFSIEKFSEIPKEKLFPLFKSLSEIGVLTVELTGGDCSIYPYTVDAINLAFEAGIQSVMILTNGIILNDELVDCIEHHKEKTFVQIDLHSLDENYFDWFTGSKNTLSKVKNNIIKLIDKGIKVRVCSIITPKNYHELLDIAEWSYNHGAILFAPSPVVELGRATDNDINRDLLFTNPDDFLKFNDLYKQLLEIYPGFVRNTAKSEKRNHNSCAALVSQCSIKSNGDIKLCTMDTGNYFNLNFGNVFESHIKDLYDKNKDFLNEFYNLHLPKKEMKECKDCLYIRFCEGCLLRGFLRAQDMKDKCTWYQNYIPQIVKDRFPLTINSTY
ncbi:TPA: radical SAM/SPASM domain-containing protein [Clostridioides difficile]